MAKMSMKQIRRSMANTQRTLIIVCKGLHQLRLEENNPNGLGKPLPKSLPKYEDLPENEKLELLTEAARHYHGYSRVKMILKWYRGLRAKGKRK